MGACCSCCCDNNDNNNGNSGRRETEMIKNPKRQSYKNDEICFDPNFKSPKVLFAPRDNKEESGKDGGGGGENDGCIIEGSGLALGSVGIEQDSAYWEFHILEDRNAPELDEDVEDDNGKMDQDNNFGSFEALQFGVSKRPQTGQNIDDFLTEKEGDCLLASIPNLSVDDVVGVAVQQSDLPMIQFLVNGEPMHHLAINRFRGTVYPAICLCDSDTTGRYKVEIVFDAARWKNEPPHPKFDAIIVARSIV